VKTRQPTGRPAPPLVMVEGETKAGKSYTLAQLAASPFVDRMFVWDLGDGTMDEYASLGDYEIVETNGTYSDLLSTVKEAAREPAADGKVNVLGIDSGTDLWDNLKDWVTERARRSKAGQQRLKEDPDNPIKPSTDLWNDAAARWAAIVQTIRTSGHVGVITAQGNDVMEMDDDGRPTKNRTWSVQSHKSLPQVVNAWVRVQRDPRAATLVGVRRLGLEIPDGGLALPLDNTLHHLIWEVIGEGTSFAPLKAVPQVVGLSKRMTQYRVLDRVKELHPTVDEERAREWVRNHCSDIGDEDDVPPSALDDLLDSVPTGELVA
jgi:hypothetical protein